MTSLEGELFEDEDHHQANEDIPLIKGGRSVDLVLDIKKAMMEKLDMTPSTINSVTG